MNSLSVISEKFTELTLDQIVRKCGGIQHTSWHFGAGFKKGDSYLSDAYRVIVDGVTEDGKPVQVKMVVKSMPQNISRRKTFRAVDFFRNECQFYEKVLPLMQKFQTERCAADVAFTEVPKLLFAHTDGVHDFIALEDLCPDGYASAPRQDGLDIVHCRLVMQTLGKFHAVSLAIADQQPKRLQSMVAELDEVYYAENTRAWYAPFLKDLIRVATDAMANEYGGTEYERKMLEFTDAQFFDRMIALTHRQSPFSVISHGDCWLTNFMLRYVDGRPMDAKMIDFQLARYASPALDISFFIYSCTLQSMREQYYDELIAVYHESATTLLRALGSDPDRVFPRSALDSELKAAARFGVGMGMESLPLTMQDDSELSDLDAIEGDQAVPLTDIWKVDIIKDATSRRRLADAFRHAIDQGYLD